MDCRRDARGRTPRRPVCAVPRPGLWYRRCIARSASYHKAFHDITAGNNLTFGPVSYQYHAGPGWVPVTGWGSPSAAVLVPLLARS